MRGSEFSVGNSPLGCSVLPAYKSFCLLHGLERLKVGLGFACCVLGLVFVLVVVEQHKSGSASACREGGGFIIT